MELLLPSFSFSILLGGWVNPWFVGVAWCCGGCEESQVWNFKGIVLKIGTNSQGFWSNVCLVPSFFDSCKRFKWGIDFGVCVKCCSSKSIKGMFEKWQIHVGDEFLWVDPFVTSWWIAAALRHASLHWLAKVRWDKERLFADPVPSCSAWSAGCW